MVLRFYTLSILLLIVSSCNESVDASSENLESIQVDGKKLFNIHCAACHQFNGTGGISGAKDLTISPLNIAEMTEIIHQGAGDMMPFRDILNPQETEAVIDHIETLKR